MKNITSFVYFVLIGLSQLSFFPVSDVHADQTYPLVCRGGKMGMRFGLVFSSNPQGWMQFLTMNFQKGTKPSYDGLDPGVCTWTDRGIKADEPTRTCQYVANSNAAMSVSWETETNRLTGVFVSNDTGYVNDMGNSNKYVTLQVYNDRQFNCFRVTRVGP